MPEQSDLHQRVIGPLSVADLGKSRLALFKCHRFTFLACDEPSFETVSYMSRSTRRAAAGHRGPTGGEVARSGS